VLPDIKLYTVSSQTTSLTDALLPADSQPQPQNLEPCSHVKSPLPSTGTNSTRPTYASVLKTQPQPELKPSTHTSRSSSLCLLEILTTQTHCNSSSTLTIGGLYNKPLSLNLVQFNTEYTDLPQHEQSLAATNSLSKFLVTALPASTRFLLDIQGGQHDNHIYYERKNYNSQIGSALRK
jgi:hypothetical protein